MMPSLPRTTPEGSSDELVGLVAHHQRVAGIVAALEAHDDVGTAGEPVHHLALAFVAPTWAPITATLAMGLGYPAGLGGGIAALAHGCA